MDKTRLPDNILYQVMAYLPMDSLGKLSFTSALSKSLVQHKIENNTILKEEDDFYTLKNLWRHGTLEEVDVSNIFGNEHFVRAWEWKKD